VFFEIRFDGMLLFGIKIMLFLGSVRSLRRNEQHFEH
jgi:hypothetical protein